MIGAIAVAGLGAVQGRDPADVRLRRRARCDRTPRSATWWWRPPARCRCCRPNWPARSSGCRPTSRPAGRETAPAAGGSSRRSGPPRLRAAAETIGPYRGVLNTQAGWDAAALKTLAAAVVSEPGLVVVLTGDGPPARRWSSRGRPTCALDAGAWMKRATAELGGRGGGRSELAQGGLEAAPDRVLAFARADARVSRDNVVTGPRGRARRLGNIETNPYRDTIALP